MTDKKAATAEQLRQVITFLLNNVEEIASEDIKRLASALLPIQLKSDNSPAPIPTPTTAAITDNEVKAIWKDSGTNDVCEITRGRKRGVIEIKFDGKPRKRTLDFLKSIKMTDSKRRAFNYHAATQVWFGPAEHFVKLTARYQYVAGENTPDLEAALNVTDDARDAHPSVGA